MGNIIDFANGADVCVTDAVVPMRTRLEWFAPSTATTAFVANDKYIPGSARRSPDST